MSPHHPKNTSDPAVLSARQLKRRYIVALSLLAILVIASQLIVQFLIADQEYDSRVVNIAGRQRMLSQKIVKTSYYIANAASADDAYRYRKELEEALSLWERSQIGLLTGDGEMGLPGKNSAEVSARFKLIQPHHEAIASSVREMLSTIQNTQQIEQGIRSIREHEAFFLNGMNDIILLYDKEAKARLDFVKWTEIGLLGITLLVLFLEATYIFAPATRRIRRDMREIANRDRRLQLSHESLEQQVQIRTMELQHANEAAQTAIDGAQLGTWHWDYPADRIDWSDECLAHFGLAAGTEMNYRKFLETIHPADRPRIEQAVLRSIESRNSYNEEYRVVWPDGSVHWLNAMGRPFHSSEGVLLRMEGVVQDVSARRAIQEQILKHSDELELKITQRTAELEVANAALRRLARHDALTELPNRLAANERLHSEFLSMKRSYNAYSVLMMDIDHFKRVNDAHGHAIGDLVLQSVAETLQATLRGSDFVARFRGEEFLALLPATDLIAARDVAEKIRKAVESSPDPTAGRITVSIGVAMATPNQESEDVAVRNADKCLYGAKEAGRNRVLMHEQTAPTERQRLPI